MNGRKKVNGITSFFLPYIKGKLTRKNIPIWSYFFTNQSCNYKCGYCFVKDNAVSMSFNTAVKSLNWLRSIGCRVVAIMGGEPLLLGERMVKIIAYSTQKNMYTYLPTNGKLLTEDLIDELALAGVGVVDLAVDTVRKNSFGLDKTLECIQEQFQMLREKSKKFGFKIKLNTVITTKNMSEVKELVEIGKKNNVSVSLHIIERPLIPYPNFVTQEDSLYFSEQEDYKKLDKLCDWIIDRKRQRYTIINPTDYFRIVKQRLKNNGTGSQDDWKCPAGKYTLGINEEGKLFYCLSLLSADLGHFNMENNGFEINDEAVKKQLADCTKKCLSCCNFNTYHFTSKPGSFIKDYCGIF